MDTYTGYVLIHALVGAFVLIFWLAIGIRAIRKVKPVTVPGKIVSTFYLEDTNHKKVAEVQEIEARRSRLMVTMLLSLIVSSLMLTLVFFSSAVPWKLSDILIIVLSSFRGYFPDVAVLPMVIAVTFVYIIVGYLALRDVPEKTYLFWIQHIQPYWDTNSQPASSADSMSSRDGSGGKATPTEKPDSPEIDIEARPQKWWEDAESDTEDESIHGAKIAWDFLVCFFGWNRGSRIGTSSPRHSSISESDLEDEGNIVRGGTKIGGFFQHYGSQIFLHMLFVFALSIFFRPLSCTVESCWSLQHIEQVVAAIMGLIAGLILYTIGLSIVRRQVHPDPMLRLNPIFFLLSIMIEFVIVFLNSLFNPWSIVTLPISTLLILILLSYNMVNQPIRGIGTKLTHYRAAFLSIPFCFGFIGSISHFLYPTTDTSWSIVIGICIVLPLMLLMFRLSRREMRKQNRRVFHKFVNLDGNTALPIQVEIIELIASLVFHRIYRKRALKVSHCLEKMVEWAGHKSADIQQHAIRALVNIASDERTHDLLITAGVGLNIKSWLLTTNEFVLHHCLRLLSKLTQRRQMIQDFIRKYHAVSGTMDTLSIVLNFDDPPEHVVCMVEQVMTQLVQSEDSGEEFFRKDYMGELLRVVRNKGFSIDTRVKALTILRSFVAHERLRPMLVAQGLPEALIQLRSARNRDIAELSATILTEVAADDEEIRLHVQRVIRMKGRVVASRQPPPSPSQAAKQRKPRRRLSTVSSQDDSKPPFALVRRPRVGSAGAKSPIKLTEFEPTTNILLPGENADEFYIDTNTSGSLYEEDDVSIGDVSMENDNESIEGRRRRSSTWSEKAAGMVRQMSRKFLHSGAVTPIEIQPGRRRASTASAVEGRNAVRSLGLSPVPLSPVKKGMGGHTQQRALSRQSSGDSLPESLGKRKKKAHRALPPKGGRVTASTGSVHKPPTPRAHSLRKQTSDDKIWKKKSPVENVKKDGILQRRAISLSTVPEEPSKKTHKRSNSWQRQAPGMERRNSNVSVESEKKTRFSKWINVAVPLKGSPATSKDDDEDMNNLPNTVFEVEKPEQEVNSPKKKRVSRAGSEVAMAATLAGLGVNT